MKPRIIGGFDAQKDRYPYAQVSLQYNISHFCGGSLLAPDLVLTAAHCFDSFDRIQFNRYNLENRSEHVETLRPVELFWHPLYNESLYHYDILIVKLDGPVSVIEPVRINRLSEVPKNGEELTAVGWGLTEEDEDDSYSDILQEVSVRYIPTDVCRTIQDGAGTVFGEYLTPDMLCAAERGKDSCYGDSGSPLISLGAGPEQDVQVGIVSWGIDCAGIFPGVYSRLSQSFDWIEKTVCAESQDPPIYFRCPSPAPSDSPRPASAPSKPIPTSENKEVLIEPDIVLTLVLHGGIGGQSNAIAVSIEKIGLFGPNELVLGFNFSSTSDSNDENKLQLQTVKVRSGNLYRVSLLSDDLCCQSIDFFYQVLMGSANAEETGSLIVSGRGDFAPRRDHIFLASEPFQQVSSRKFRNLTLMIQFDDNPIDFSWAILEHDNALQSQPESEFQIVAYGPHVSYTDEQKFGETSEVIALPVDDTESSKVYTLVVRDSGGSSYTLIDGRAGSHDILAQSTISNNRNYHSFTLPDIAGQDEASASSVQGGPKDLLRKSGAFRFDKPVVLTFLLSLLSCVQEVT